MNGHPPVTSHINVLGCVCYVLIDTNDPRRYKLSPTSLKGIFIGYCESHTHYRVYILSKAGRDKVVFSANVRYHEDKFWDWERTNSEQLVQLKDISLEENIVVNSDSDNSVKGYLEVESLLISPSTTFVPNSHLSSEVEPFSMNEQNNESTEISLVPTFESLPFPGEPDIAQPHLTPNETTNIPSSGETPSVTAVRKSSRIHKRIEHRSAWQPKPRDFHIGGDIPITRTHKEAINASNNLN